MIFMMMMFVTLLYRIRFYGYLMDSLVNLRFDRNIDIEEFKIN